MKLTLEQIDRTINNLVRLMPARPNKNSTREYSLKESIFLMAPKLLEMREMGFTTKELVSALADEEIVIKGATLNHYLCEYQKQSQEKVEANPEQPTNTKPNPAVGANPDQTANTNPNPALGADFKPTTESESEHATAVKPERTAAPDQSYSGGQSYQSKAPVTPVGQDAQKRDKYPTQNQSSNNSKPSTWQSEKRRENDSGAV